MKLFLLGALVASAINACHATTYSWTTVSKNVGTSATGIAFINSSFGYVPADANGNGAEVLISSDGGKTWAPTSHQGGFLFLDVSAYGGNAVVSGVFGEEYSSNYGADFQTSTHGGTGQCVRNINRFGTGGPDGFGVAGQFGEDDGIAVSFDDGKTFTDMPIAELKTDARYASFPTKDDFFVSAGQWPEPAPSQDDDINNDDFSLRGNKNKLPDVIHKTRHFSLRRKGNGYVPHVEFASAPAGNGSFQAQVVVSHDGGKSFVSVLYDDSNYYANGIDCESATSCCMVGEADQGPAPGARIHCTTNGGHTWTQTLFQSGGQNSLIDIRWVDKDEYWAVGGVFNEISANAQFLHTTDGGNTWTAAPSIEGYATSVDCTGPSNCWATLTHVITQSTSIAALQVS
eukprot:gb/GECG01009701.1/.p1 GENE.gb/GECG01009701.1/~~gb/GECG01009701.1/.p1  ORF type:complete len:401 (+),score=51.95 gb/GECG01009701.1/:1-1203(+)